TVTPAIENHVGGGRFRFPAANVVGTGYRSPNPSACCCCSPVLEPSESTQSKQLQCGKQNEFGAIDEVAPPESTRLLKQPEEPFQPALLHPARGLLLGSRMNVKGRPHSQNHGCVQMITMLV